MNIKIISEENISINNIDKFANIVASTLKNKDILIMEGNLGYGKTTLTRAVAKILNSDNIVSSPSFTLINEYDIYLDGKKTVLRHIDLYRLDNYDELYNIALDEIIANDGISIIEWGNKFIDFFTTPYYLLNIAFISDSDRTFKLSYVQ